MATGQALAGHDRAAPSNEFARPAEAGYSSLACKRNRSNSPSAFPRPSLTPALANARVLCSFSMLCAPRR